MAFCDVEYIDSKGNAIGVQVTFQDFCQDIFFVQLLERNRIATTSAVMVRRSAIQNAAGFNESFARSEDYDLWIRLAAKHPAYQYNEPIVSYRHYKNNISRDKKLHREGKKSALLKHSIQTIRNALAALYDSEASFWLALSAILFRIEKFGAGQKNPIG
jgi:GT2 family glycosyltransferase